MSKSKVRKTGFAFAAMLLFAALLTACGGGGSTTESGTDTSGGGGGESADIACPIKIGQAIAETGFAAPFDVPSAEAAKIKVAEMNKEGGIDGCEVELASADMKTEQQLSAPTATRLIENDANYLITTADYDFGSPAARVACEKELVAFAPSASSPNYGVQGIGPCAYTMGTVSQAQGAALAQFGSDELNVESIYVLTDTSLAATKQVVEGFKERAEDVGIKVAGESTFQNEDPSISSQITQIKGASPEAILLASYPPGGASAVKQIRAAGIKVPILASDGFDSESWTEGIPQLSDFYLTAMASTFGDDPDQRINEFVKKYEKAVGEQPPAFAVGGYSTIEALQIATEGAGSVEGPAVEDALNGFEGQELLAGPTTFTAEQHYPVNRAGENSAGAKR